MATQLPNRLRRHGNRSELAFSRVTHLQAFPILQLCVSHAVFSFISSGGFFVSVFPARHQKISIRPCDTCVYAS